MNISVSTHSAAWTRSSDTSALTVLFADEMAPFLDFQALRCIDKDEDWDLLEPSSSSVDRSSGTDLRSGTARNRLLARFKMRSLNERKWAFILRACDMLWTDTDDMSSVRNCYREIDFYQVRESFIHCTLISSEESTEYTYKRDGELILAIIQTPGMVRWLIPWFSNLTFAKFNLSTAGQLP